MSTHIHSSSSQKQAYILPIFLIFKRNYIKQKFQVYSKQPFHFENALFINHKTFLHLFLLYIALHTFIYNTFIQSFI